MTTPITIEAFEVQGFRAYLKPQSFSLRKGNKPASLAIFAPNAKGKSSLVDAFEYYFSEDATLQRLGLRASQSQTGPVALAHIQAREHGIDAEVNFRFRQGGNKLGEKRNVADGKSIPTAALRVLSSAKVPFVIHGYELRGFVEATAETRYREIASWFSFDPLLSIQRNLRTLQRQIKAKADSQTESDERLRDLKRVTSDAVSIWDETAIRDWFNTHVLANLDPSLIFTEICESDPTYIVLAERKDEEEKRVGLAALNTLIGQIDAVSLPLADNDGELSGLIAKFERSVSDLGVAVERESQERDRASQSVFNDVWSHAKSLFKSEDHDFSSCPVCDTEFASTPHGSLEGVQTSINAKLTLLSAYRQAESTLRTAKQQQSQNVQALTNALDSLRTGLADSDFEAESATVSSYLSALTSWASDHHALPDSGFLLQEMGATRISLTNARERLAAQQGEHTYTQAQNTADQLIQIRTDLNRIFRVKGELQKLLAELVKQTNATEKAINTHIDSLLSELERDVDQLYKKIQDVPLDEPSLIRLQLAEGNAANQQQIRLVVDYSENRKSVAPSGYLSDSQIHTVALSLRLAAIRKFNTGAPMFVLDDVVTSYDADHRKTIASTLAEEFEGFQIVLVTHDEQFFNLLQDHLPESNWAFRRITHIDPSSGPVFTDHRTSDEVIEAKLDAGEPVGDDIRKSEEEWLLKICRDFRVDISIRPVDRPYQYERGELASGLARFLKSKNLVPPDVHGIHHPFLSSLQKGVIENFASHFSDNPNKSFSSGDEKTRWIEFRSFRAMFVCSGCGRNRFKRPQGMSKPVCNVCEKPFQFEILG